ncbi:SLC13 family permease [Radiobacillus sp. PE A8.2]|uniref:SLC13 family permease n=1 Tax=Radiobacillus sp. PE A8.2 TaxID=3380349 RepID=UPI00388D8B6B
MDDVPLTWEMAFVSLMDIDMLVGLLLEVARPDMIIFAVLIIFLITGILTAEEAVQGFSNQGMLTIALLFIVAGAVQNSGLIDQLRDTHYDPVNIYLNYS